MNEIGVTELREKIDACFLKRAEYEAKKKESSELYADLKRMQQEIINIMEELEINKFEGEQGTISYKYTESFKVPKDPDSRLKFFSYLRDKGVYDEMITVNSKTLNSWAKQEAELAEDQGEFDFQIPGLVKSDPIATPLMRKK